MNEVTDTVSPQYAIELQGLTRSFGAHKVLKGIDLQVNAGERLAVFGPNGAGKTTLIKIMATLIRPSSGTVLICGKSIHDRPELIRSRLGVMGHNTFLYDNLTVYDNLKFYGRMYGVKDLDNAVREVIERVRLKSRLYDRVGTLSRGMQQRVSLARAIIHSPSILFLDEPETGLDPHAVSIMQGILDVPGTERNTVLFTTHNMERGLELCDRLAILSGGRIVYQKPKKEIDTANFRSVYDSFTGTGT